MDVVGDMGSRVLSTGQKDFNACVIANRQLEKLKEGRGQGREGGVGSVRLLDVPFGS